MFGSAYAIADYRNDLAISNYDGDDIHFGFGNFNPKMTILNNGYVGIGDRAGQIAG